MAYFDPNFHSLEEYITPPPIVSFDNDTYPDRTVVKLSGVNRHGVLADIVEALTDLDLVISKSNISADGDWIMDDELGNKVTEPGHIRYIQDSLMFAEGRGGENRRPPNEVKTCLNNLVGAEHLPSDHTMIEMTVGDEHRGLLSEVLATLLNLSFEVHSIVAWTHNGRAGFILRVADLRRTISSDPIRLAELEAQLTRVVEAHGGIGKWRLRISVPEKLDRVHNERRLHQIMQEGNDWAGMAGKSPASDAVVTAVEMEVSVNNIKKKHNYMVEVTVVSRDRPKLLFDTACTLADLNYDVVHASVSTGEGIAVQEYYVKKRDWWLRVTEMEKKRLVGCLMAAVERRQGGWEMRVEVRVEEYRWSLLWKITRVLRESGLFVVGAKWEKRGESAGGVFYVRGGSSTACGLMQALRSQIPGCIFQIK